MQGCRGCFVIVSCRGVGETDMKLVTGSQMADMDRRAVQEMGVPGLDLMENAGRAVFERARRMLSTCCGGKAVVVCGQGNNGGDGFVVARYLRAQGVEVVAFLVGRRDAVRGDARAHLERALGLGIPVKEVTGETELGTVAQEVSRAALIVDAVLGTGMKGAVRGLAADVIGRMNASGRPILSVDLPSGVNADTGQVDGPCVRAQVTVTFGLPKMGHAFYPGKAYCGALEVADIGFPCGVLEEAASLAEWVTSEEVASVLPRRRPDAHKGDCGRVVVIAGSVGLTGAAALASMGALRTGAGLVTLAVPESLNDILEVKLTEVMTRPVPEVRKRRCLSLRAVGEIRRLMEKADGLALGPGIGTHRETVELVARIVRETAIPTVIDADGLNSLARDSTPLRDTAAEVVLTPHPGELSRLLGKSVSEIVSDPMGAAQEASERLRAVVVLKGAPTVTATREGALYVNSTGNAGMATGGSGDVLTGVVVGLIGQGLSPSDAAWSGVFVHGLAGDLAKAKKGEMGMIAGDILEAVPEALQLLRSKPT